MPEQRPESSMPPVAPDLEGDPVAPPDNARFIIKPIADHPVSVGRNIQSRRMFTTAEDRFESSFQFVLYNVLPVGETNVRHIHEDIEKVYYFLKGNAEIDCGPWRTTASAGDFLFFPANIAHQIYSQGPDDLEFIVCAAQTVSEARGMDDGGLMESED